jgi:hypothetical protein
MTIPDCHPFSKECTLGANRLWKPCRSAFHTRGLLGNMRKKTAFNEGHFWENVGMFVFVLAGLVGLWYMMTNVISW